MASRPYHVTPRNNDDDNRGDWQVKRAGANRAYSTHDKKNVAVREAKKVARRQRVGVTIHRKNGTVQYGYKCSTSGSRAKMVRTDR